MWMTSKMGDLPYPKDMVIADKTDRHSTRKVVFERGLCKVWITAQCRVSKLADGTPVGDFTRARQAIASASLMKIADRVTVNGTEVRFITWAGREVPKEKIMCNVRMEDRKAPEDEPWRFLCVRAAFDPKAGRMVINSEQGWNINLKRPDLEENGGLFSVEG